MITWCVVQPPNPFSPYEIPFEPRSDSESETSIPEVETETDTDMSEETRTILKDRFSRPQYVDRWDIYRLIFSNGCWYCDIR